MPAAAEEVQEAEAAEEEVEVAVAEGVEPECEAARKHVQYAHLFQTPPARAQEPSLKRQPSSSKLTYSSSLFVSFSLSSLSEGFEEQDEQSQGHAECLRNRPICWRN